MVALSTSGQAQRDSVLLQKPLSEKMHAQEQSCAWRGKDHMAEKQHRKQELKRRERVKRRKKFMSQKVEG